MKLFTMIIHGCIEDTDLEIGRAKFVNGRLFIFNALYYSTPNRLKNKF